MADEWMPSGQEGSQREAEEPAEAQAPEATPEAETPAERIREPAAEPLREERRSYLLTAGISAAVVVLGAALFVAGFLTHSLLDDDVDLDPINEALATLNKQTGEIQDRLSGAGGDAGGGASPTPAPLVAATADDDPFIGPEDASVTVIEFIDYQWPFCKRFRDETLDQILDTYEGQIKLVVRDFPLNSIHPYAQKSAEASECADDQGKFWEYHDVVFANQSAIDVDSLKGYAAQLGLDTGAFNECLDEGKHQGEVEKDLQDGRGAGATGTPAFFINGQLVSGAQPFSVFQQAIDAALADEG